MWLGPVFQAELMTLARRSWFYTGRIVYGLFVLAVVGTTYRSIAWRYDNSPEIPIDQLATFGQAIFAAFATLQGAVVLVMTPSLVAGAIADEKQRKTLHYLMASQLTATEIVLGKVTARLLRMAVIGAIGLPILNLVALFGGVDFKIVLAVYAATATTTFFLASLSILSSVYAPKPRDAIAQAYLFELLWLGVAPLLLGTMRNWNPVWLRVGEFCQPVLEWISASSPTNLIRNGPIVVLSSTRMLIEQVAWMMGLQVVAGSVLIAIAAWRLRPVFREEGAPGFWARVFRRKPKSSRPRLWDRPPVSDQAMLWKEMHLYRISDFRRVMLIALGLMIVGFTIYSAWDLLKGAVGEIQNEGFWTYGFNRRELTSLLRFINGLIMVVLLVGLGSIAATSVSAEREGDTWTNLAASPVDGLEVMGSKIVGALWLFRPLMYFLGACWLFGLLIGSVHPLGALISLVELVVFSWFAASLGVAISLRAKNTTQAMTFTFGILLFCNVGYLFFFALMRADTMLIVFGCMPLLFGVGLLGINETTLYNSSMPIFAASVLGTVGYGVAALLLTITSIAAYDRFADRPDRLRNELTPEVLRKVFQGMAKPKPLVTEEV